MQSNYSARLYQAARRTLRCCANGENPNSRDVQLLSRYAPSSLIGLNPAELAGIVIWRIQTAAESFRSVA
jgi:hypothetical protein